jgi:hypothetical protein
MLLAMFLAFYICKKGLLRKLNMILLGSLWEQEKTRAARLRHGDKISRIINEHVFGSHDDPGTYSVTMDEKSGGVGEVKFNDGYAKLVELKLSALLPKLLTKPEYVCSDWTLCFDGISHILTTSKQRPDFTNHQILDLETKIMA